LDANRVLWGLWRWPGGADTAQPQGLFAGERVGAGAQQLAGGDVNEQQGLVFDADPDQHAAQPFGGQDLRVGQGYQPGVGHDPFDVQCGAVLGAGQRRRPGRDRALGDQLGQIGGRQVGAVGLDARPSKNFEVFERVNRSPIAVPPGSDRSQSCRSCGGSWLWFASML